MCESRRKKVCTNIYVMENRKKNDWGSKIPKKKFYCIVIKLKLFDVFDTLGC